MFGKPILEKKRSKKLFLKNAFWKIFSLKCLENAWKNLRTVDPRIEAKNQGAKFQLKKARPKSQARSFKKSIQISKQQPKNGAARFSAPPRFWAAPLARRVVVLKFVSIFCRTWLGFLAGWILCWPMLWDGFFHGFFGRQKKTFSKSGPKNIFPNSGPKKTVFV